MEKWEKKTQDMQKTIRKLADVNSPLSVIILNVYSLASLIKRQRLEGLIKVYAIYKKPFTFYFFKKVM